MLELNEGKWAGLISCLDKKKTVRTTCVAVAEPPIYMVPSRESLHLNPSVRLPSHSSSSWWLLVAMLCNEWVVHIYSKPR